MEKTQRIIAFSCPHCPLEDHAAITWLLDLVEDEKPSMIVHLGDGHEADSASRWPGEADWDLRDEFRAHNQLLKDLKFAAPAARRVFLPGNHDDNLIALNRIDKRLRGLADYRHQLEHEPEMMSWEQPTIYEFSRRGVFQVGKVTFCHGYKAGIGSDEQHAFILTPPGGLYVGGHTHRPQAVAQAMKNRINLPFWYSNAGTLRDIWNVDYMKRKDRSQWGQAAVIVETGVDPTSSWSAEVKIRRMFTQGPEELVN